MSDFQRLCPKCERGRTPGTREDHAAHLAEVKGGRLVVTHDQYGCDTGCCGHVLHFYDAKDRLVTSLFDFDHQTDFGRDRAEAFGMTYENECEGCRSSPDGFCSY